MRTSFLIFAIAGAVVITQCQSQQSTDCPENFWDGPTKECVASIDTVLNDLHKGEWQMADVRINRTCQAHEEMAGCMAELTERCQKNEVAVRDLGQIVERYTPYALPCHDERLRHRQRLVDCFHNHIPDTRKCVNEFDDHFQSNILKDDYKAACKDIEEVVRCFHTHKSQIGRECQREGAHEYHVDYILPVVRPTGHTVREHCHDLPSPYRQYYSMDGSGASALAARVFVAIVLTFLGFL